MTEKDSKITLTIGVHSQGFHRKMVGLVLLHFVLKYRSLKAIGSFVPDKCSTLSKSSSLISVPVSLSSKLPIITFNLLYNSIVCSLTFNTHRFLPKCVHDADMHRRVTMYRLLKHSLPYLTLKIRLQV